MARPARSKGGRDGKVASTELRQRVLTTSETLLESEGLNALSMREVARRAGVTHQAPYHHFADKEAILAALVTSGFDDLARRLAEASAASAGASPRALLVRTGRAYVGFALERPGVFRIMFRSDLVDFRRFPEAAAAGARAHAELERLVRSVHPRSHPATHASLHWSVVHGLACLLLDGNFEEHVRGKSDRRAHADRVLELHARQATGG